jgi:hypothetical protein
MREEDLWDMSDEDLEAAFKAASYPDDQTTDTEEFNESSLSAEDGFDEDVSLDDTDDIDDGPEQPEEDSGHDTSEETNAEAELGVDASESEDSTTDEDASSEDENRSDSDDDAEEESQPVQSYKFKANGKDYEFSSKEIVEQFPKIFGQAMDYTKKMQTIKPWRKTIDAIEEAKLNHSDISLMIDVLKGDKGAITEVLKRTGVDTLELDTEADSNYITKDYGRDDSALAIKDIVDDISQDVEYATTHNILSKEWDGASWNIMSQNPEMIRLLHADVKSGMYQTLQPLVEKLKVFDGGKKSDLDYYKEAAQQHFARVAQQEAHQRQVTGRQADKETRVVAQEQERSRLDEVKAKSQQRTAVKQASAKRKAAAPTKAGISGKAVIDYLEDSDEAFDDWYKRLQEDM